MKGKVKCERVAETQWSAQTFWRAGMKEKKKGTYSAFSPLKRALRRAFLPTKRAVYHVLTSQGGSLVCFAN